MVASSNPFSAQDTASNLNAIHSAASTMVLTLPSSKMRKGPLSPPSVIPPSVSTDISSLQQLERDRCKSPSQMRASALLAKVAVLPSVPTATAPMPTASGMCSPGLTSSNSSSPASSPPGEGDQFSFHTFPKQLPTSPNGTYISFPDFDQFCDSTSSEDEDCQPKKRC
ncbi:hypothetical protein BDZ91DRAFT_482374 [Kalaharituber pfeilii]|nr:hypothetical protein BDZ91DRAFT_482374 [Kalaharituber pfeilii]